MRTAGLPPVELPPDGPPGRGAVAWVDSMPIPGGVLPPQPTSTLSPSPASQDPARRHRRLVGAAVTTPTVRRRFAGRGVGGGWAGGGGGRGRSRAAGMQVRGVPAWAGAGSYGRVRAWDLPLRLAMARCAARART